MFDKYIRYIRNYVIGLNDYNCIFWVVDLFLVLFFFK